MNYLFQNDPALYQVIQRIGCFFRSALHLAELKAGRALTAQEINALWEKSKKLEYITTLHGEKNCVANSAAIANLALQTLGCFGKFVEVAVFRNGTFTWYASVKERRADAFIQKIRQGGPSKTHFRCVDKTGGVIFEPHDPPIKSLGIFYTICYRFDGGENDTDKQ